VIAEGVVFGPEQLPELRRKIRVQAARDSRLLSELVGQARELAPDVRPIRPRAATAVALTAADGGNNAVAFNPFSLQIVRVVDSQGKELFLDVVSPSTDVGELSRPRRGPIPNAQGRLRPGYSSPKPWKTSSTRRPRRNSRSAQRRLCELVEAGRSDFLSVP
jgi:hypothetical protein